MKDKHENIAILVLPCPLREDEQKRVLKYVSRVLNDRFREKKNGKN